MMANTKNGSAGMPGMSPMANIVPDAMSVALGCELTCDIRLGPRLVLLVSLVTRTPAAVEMNSAGIWLTRPSPMVSLE